MTASIHVRVGTRDTIALDVVQQIARLAHAAVLERGVFCLAIPGGSVTETVLPLLASAVLPWSSVHVFWVDERVVPRSSPESNMGRAFSLIRDTPMALEAAFHGMLVEREDSPEQLETSLHDAVALDHAAASYTETLRVHAGTPPILDVALLGVGDDGHVASLFPGHAASQERVQSVVIEAKAPKPPALRMSLAAPVLWRARCIIVSAFGLSKAAAIGNALERSESDSPVAQLLQNATHVVVTLDHDAASLLSHTTRVQLE